MARLAAGIGCLDYGMDRLFDPLRDKDWFPKFW
jgi:hypothetical protein